jgi:Fur family transcriptional regulator, ferric uptake regulator
MTSRQPDASSVVRRSGRARRRVLNALEAVERPISAEELAEQVPDVHLSSVYRALSVLEEDGVVTHVHLGHGPAVYQLTQAAADVRHLVCDTCGRQLVVPATVFACLAATLQDEYGFVLDAGHFAVVGHCTTCAHR